MRPNIADGRLARRRHRLCGADRLDHPLSGAQFAGGEQFRPASKRRFSVIGQNKFKSIKDLKGAVIGLTSIAGTNHISVRMTLKQFGLDIDKDVKILAIGDERLVYDTFKLGRG